MSSFGVGVYLLTVLWFITFMLCWVSVKTGHYVGKAAVSVTLVLSVLLMVLPKGDVIYSHGANFYDKLFIPRYIILAVLFVSVLAGAVYCFIHVCLTPVETKKFRTFGSTQ